MNSAPLTVRLRPSRVLAFFLLTGHLLGVLALAVSLDGIALALTVAGVGLSAIATTGAALHHWADSARELELREDGRCAWRDRRGRWHESAIASGGYVSPLLIIVPLAGPGWRRKWLVIPSDAAGAEDRRRLRVWLRWRPGKYSPEAK